MKSILTIIFLAIVVPALASPTAQAQLGATVPNWTVPSSSSGSHSGGVRTMGDVTSPVPFIGVTPCRIVDTRGPAGPFGAPALTSGVPRNFALPGGPCAGIPPSVSAYSLNITVTNTAGPGFILMFPQGGVAPVVSTLNYIAGQTVANAAIVPAGAGGGVTVIAGVSGTDLIIDINGYYGPTPNTSSSFFLVLNNSPSWLIEAFNSSTTCAGPCGILGATSSGDAVTGSSFGMTGATSGVFGSNSSLSFDSAGVKGVDSSGSPANASLFFPSGVRGESATNTGVSGFSRNLAVLGTLLDVAGNLVAQGILGSSIDIAADTTGPPWGVFAFGNLGASGAKHFVEPSATDASKVIVYSSLEGREVGTYFRGTARFVNREAIIPVPEDFRIVTDESGLTVQLTPIGELATVAVISQDLNEIVVRSSRDVAFHYLVQGVRRAFKDFQPVRTGHEFMPRTPSEKMPGYLTEEAKQRLIANGTYNADGTVNMLTARRLGWDRVWEARAKPGPEAKAPTQGE